jgi:hypothetical protein
MGRDKRRCAHMTAVIVDPLRYWRWQVNVALRYRESFKTSLNNQCPPIIAISPILICEIPEAEVGGSNF